MEDIHSHVPFGQTTRPSTAETSSREKTSEAPMCPSSPMLCSLRHGDVRSKVTALKRGPGGADSSPLVEQTFITQEPEARTDDRWTQRSTGEGPRVGCQTLDPGGRRKLINRTLDSAGAYAVMGWS
ncbi:hypothetical protein EYF80_058611 [Liparis tanakae]|uniref:Uncharacterized protein n=1 Tax=Liparis tanakae TaxID=230148 RepID=A0A4Z2EQL8_9TELE|nr:hypothetical protein EYF80_058611 [Liparis tanakae]